MVFLACQVETSSEVEQPEDSFSWLARIYASQDSTVSDVHPIYVVFIRLCTIWFWGCLLRFFLLEVHANTIDPHKFVSRLDGAASAAASGIQDPWRGSERIRMVAYGKLEETREHHCSVAVPFLSPCFMNRTSNADRATAGHVTNGRKIGVFVIYWVPRCFRSLALQILLLRFFHSIYPPISITHSFATSLHSPSETLKMASIACWLSPVDQDGQSTKPVETVDVPDVLSFKLFGRDMRTVQVHVGLKGPSTRQGCG